MRYFIIFLSAVVCIIALNFFISPSENTENKLIISPYVFNEGVADPNEFNENTVFNFEPLELNKVRLMAPTAGADMWNLNVLFEYEGGAIEVITDDVQISISSYAKPFYYSDDGFKGRRYGYNMLLNDSGYLSFYPIGGCHGYHDLDDKVIAARQNPPETGHEYYITVNAYKDAGYEWPTYTAILKLLKLEENSPYFNSTNVSRFFSIELVSYD